MNERTYIALDLGSSRISALVAEVLDNGAVRILGSESKISDDVKHGIIEHPSGCAFKVNELLKLLQNSSRIHDIQQVCVGINARSMKVISGLVTRFVGQNKMVTDMLINEMKDECARKYSQNDLIAFQIIPVKYQLDEEYLTNPVGKKGVQITGYYNVVIGNKLIKERFDGCFDRTGITVEYSPLAIESLATVLVEEDERKNGCALIDFGATTTTLGVYKNDILQQLLVIPLGGENITSDIEELGIKKSYAERLKCLKGVAMVKFVENPIYVEMPSENAEENLRISTSFLANIINARLEEITQPIFKFINQLPFPLEGGIIITGGASKLNYLKEFIEENTELPVRFGNHSEWLDDKTPEKFFNDTYSQLIGTIVLTDEYRKLNPTNVQSKKEPKIKRNFKDKLTEHIISLFDDDNEMK